MADNKTQLPNLKICIDNTDQVTDDEETREQSSDKADFSIPDDPDGDASDTSDDVQVNVNIYSGTKSKPDFPRNVSLFVCWRLTSLLNI